MEGGHLELALPKIARHRVFKDKPKVKQIQHLRLLRLLSTESSEMGPTIPFSQDSRDFPRGIHSWTRAERGYTALTVWTGLPKGIV